MKTIVVGLGLMGGSMAMAIRKYTNHEVYGWNRTASVVEKAMTEGVIHGIADATTFAEADLVIISLYPQSTVDFLLEWMPKMKKGCIIVDLVGIKRFMEDRLAKAAQQAGVHFIGGHPMAGKEFSGYAFAAAELFHDASMILVPNESSPLWAVDEMEGFFISQN